MDLKPVIELDNVSKTYSLDSVKVNALDKVSLKISKGDFVSIIGPSGSGKSTMLHILGALDRPSSGKVEIDGTDLTKLSDSQVARLRGKKIGFVFQFFNLYPTLTAIENVELPMMIMEIPEHERKKRAAELIEKVGLKQRANHLPAQLSGGERQRVAIARALANNPTFILADEPTGNLDSKTGIELMKFLGKINKDSGTTLIIVTHDRTVADFADKKIELMDGKILN
ncbi:MAG TPA: ABC transporter ATP-binding protein [archaeon]|nr:ABC transporter ATP-binding protein [archaeon]